MRGKASDDKQQYPTDFGKGPALTTTPVSQSLELYFMWKYYCELQQSCLFPTV